MKIEICPYNKEWKTQFLQIRSKLLKLLKDVHIEHIGSTSVKGLAAKPIIDILIGIDQLSRLDDTIHLVEKIGFKYVSKYEKDLPNRRFFIFEENDKRMCHIHIVKKDTYWFNRHIAFRDALRNNKEVCANYQLLKLQLARKDWKSGDAYSEAKTHFIRAIEKSSLNGHKNISK